MIRPAGAAIVGAQAMRAAEQALFDGGMAQDALMERAGAAVAREAARFAVRRPILVLAGPGNNGGDAYVVARLLAEQGGDVRVAALGAAKDGSATRMRGLWRGETVALADAEPRAFLVDGLFGTGLTRPLAGDVATKLAALSAAAEFTLAIDLPSGLDTDSGVSLGAAQANLTIALGALKPAHLLGDGAGLCGDVIVADIGVPVSYDWRALARPVLAAPARDAHKYSRGLVVVVEGAMPGAARLAARAALSGGAGYVILAGGSRQGPDALVHSDAPLAKILDDDRIAAVVVGPGLGRDDAARAALETALGCRHALVLDGDALSLLGDTAAARVAERPAQTYLTPHSGEFDRMFAGSGGKIARTLAAARAATIIHKGADTVIATPDGQVRIGSGPSWLSTAGTGDVLAGLLAARHAPAGSPRDAAEQAVWLHARAARLAGPAFAADDLIGQLPAAIEECLCATTN
jgi:hydroxyethylthiazole kinase-like uncharacterized protein yjeF